MAIFARESTYWCTLFCGALIFLISSCAKPDMHGLAQAGAYNYWGFLGYARGPPKRGAPTCSLLCGNAQNPFWPGYGPMGLSSRACLELARCLGLGLALCLGPGGQERPRRVPGEAQEARRGPGGAKRGQRAQESPGETQERRGEAQEAKNSPGVSNLNISPTPPLIIICWKPHLRQGSWLVALLTLG